MQKKHKTLIGVHRGMESAEEMFRDRPVEFLYGDLSKLPVYSGSSPAVMKEQIARMSWQDKLASDTVKEKLRPKFKHEHWRHRALSWVEKNLFGGKQILKRRNYLLIDC